MYNVSCAILAGGQSRRFGSDKTLATLNGYTFTEILAIKLAKISKDVMIIAKDPGKFCFKSDHARFLKDFSDSQSPLVGIITALNNADYNPVFIISADTPFLNLELVTYMYDFTEDNDIVVTRIGEKINTLCGFYSKKVVDKFVAACNNNIYRIIELYNDFHVKVIDDIDVIKKYDSKLLSFFNINTLEDYEHAKEIAQESGIGI